MATAEPFTATSSPWDRRFPLVCFLLCLALNLGFSSIGWNNGIREVHESRQVQTALSARHLQREGLSVDYPLPLFGPPWSAPFEFPLYQGTVAVVANLTGMGLEQAGRLTALLYFYGSLPACFLLAGYLGLPAGRRWLLPALLLVSPVYVYYSRSFMIESAAFCVAAWFLLAFCRSLDRPGWTWPAIAAATGMLAAATKLTTLVVFLVPAALFTLQQAWSRFRVAQPGRPAWMVLVLAAGLAGVSVAAGLLWTRHADAVKASNPLADAFLSGFLRPFLFGEFGMRFEAGFWDKILTHVTRVVLPAANLMLVLVFGLLAGVRPGLASLALVGSFLSGPLVFANLYAVHDYYFYASGVFALGALVVAWSTLLDASVLPRLARLAVIVVSLGLQVWTFARGYLPPQRHPAAPPELPGLINRLTGPDDLIVVYGQDWNPMTSYYSDRRAIMVVDRYFEQGWRLDEVLRRVDRDRVKALILAGNLRREPGAGRAIADNLGLYPRAAVVGHEGHLYVSPEMVGPLQALVQDQPLAGHTLTELDPEFEQIERKRFSPANLPDPRVISMMQPTPLEFVHPFGTSVYEIEGQVVADAHAPTDVIFRIPAGTARAEIEFGILPGAYADDVATDGVEFRVDFQPLDGKRRVLFTRLLRPAAQASDRGTQKAVVVIANAEEGRLLLRTLPGPTGVFSKDWGYWGRIDIR